MTRHSADKDNSLRSDLPTAARDLPALISVPQAARILGLSRASAYRYAAAGELPTKRFGSRIYIITAKIKPLIDGSEEST